MAVQKSAGNYWMTRSIRIDPESFGVMVVLDLYANQAAFVAGNDPQSTIQFAFPPNTFTNQAITNILNSVEAKIVLQPAFSGGIVV